MILHLIFLIPNPRERLIQCFLIWVERSVCWGLVGGSDSEIPKQNGTVSNGDGLHADKSTKDERIITSGGVPKNGKFFGIQSSEKVVREHG